MDGLDMLIESNLQTEINIKDPKGKYPTRLILNRHLKASFYIAQYLVLTQEDRSKRFTLYFPGISVH